ncbi:EpsG family protein [Pseudomonas sp. 32A]|uniref:EpsG family protein n=1 Tax=Pseudomonas sp. 32A TaxID=651185 RepID=UPI00404585D3
MAFYILSTLFFACVSTLGGQIRWPRTFVIFGLMPMILLALLRGDVGVDTAVYLQEIQKIIEAGKYTHTFEPFFEGLILLLSSVLDNPRAILAVLGAFTTLFLVLGVVDKKQSLFIFCAFIMPTYYFDMVMNGIRYGLSFAIVFWAQQYLREFQVKKFIVWVVVASLIQSSGGVLGLILYVLYSRQWKVLIGSGVLFGTGFAAAYPYFMAKLQSYSEIYTASIFSGLSTLAVTACSLSIWMLDPGTRKNTLPACLVLLGLSFFMFGLAQYSYAGLRFLQLISFGTFLYFAISISGQRVVLSNITKITLVAVAVIAFVLKMKNFSDSVGEGASPFVPYMFFWE